MVQIAEEFERPSRGWMRVDEGYELRDFKLIPQYSPAFRIGYKNFRPYRKDIEQLREILNAKVDHVVEWTDDSRGLTLYWFSRLHDSYSLGERFELYPNEYLLLSDNQALHLYDRKNYTGTITIP